MRRMIAALPMYDWPEIRAETDAEWAGLAARLRAAGLAAPPRLARSNGDLPAVPGGIRDRRGRAVAPDPATLPPDALDVGTLWRHPDLFLAQTCWGPLETTDLAAHVAVVGQPDYSAYAGGAGPDYASALLMRRGAGAPVPPPGDGRAVLPVARLAGLRLAFNGPDSMSGLLALARDLAALGRGIEVFAARAATGSHRASARAVAEGRADLCAVDCRSWALLRRVEPALAGRLAVVGWTARRKGLPYVTAAGRPAAEIAALRTALAG
ncbi:PhnD/SsuA/transferrin family substrate-binding protein [Aquibium sp. A9E412]|uniref:PhnD/SsuA/transferrin family substrate-binding protein n=1 Tax=Aquibium sp. A9E412 TaxID=2976767 RepID=UPI0025B0EC53|nr:PhnD/SsuA/transferrin family substrate-binding protein [Aquibium sp. A9E412]MDN2568025.1 PhnD/SsuA/transferrin family substrate-binding protein [Aquibium sp. A9E412]